MAIQRQLADVALEVVIENVVAFDAVIAGSCEVPTLVVTILNIAAGQGDTGNPFQGKTIRIF